MVTARANVDVKAGTLSNTILVKTIEFEIFKAARYPHEESECFMMDILDELIQQTFEGSYTNNILPLVLTNNACMSIKYLQDLLTQKAMQAIAASVEAIPPYIVKYFSKFERLPTSNSKLLSFVV